MINQAYKFINTHKNDTDEKQQAQAWIKDLFEDVFQIYRREVNAGFELQVKRNKNNKYIDHLLPGILLTEMKSKGKDLDTAQEQAMQYVFDLDNDRKPKFVMLSDFEYIRLINLDKQDTIQFRVEELVQYIAVFNFLTNREIKVTEPQSPVNKEAAMRLEKLHKKLREMNYPRNNTTLLMTRLVFCFFAENTQIFEIGEFHDYLLHHTQRDGSDLLDKLHNLFVVLNTPEEERFQSDPLSNFPYINGGLFEVPIKTGAILGTEAREMLIELTQLDWSQISPVIFGSMFEGAMNSDKRHDLGAHFTSEKSILKVIDSLFLEELIEEYEKIMKVKRDKLKKLHAFHDKLVNLKFLDPACGSGNFLIISYREIRRLEHDVIQQIRIEEFGGVESVLSVDYEIKVEVSQFYGIEIQPYAVSIARLGMWIMDHLMNLEASSKFGQLYVRLPLHTGANIIRGDALELVWDEIVSRNELDYILGNPPFLGNSMLDDEQREQVNQVTNVLDRKGHLDFVAAWYIKSAQYIKDTTIRVALVSTNSVSQGEQATNLFKYVLDRCRNTIDFAHQTFKWDNNGAQVYVVIIGFSSAKTKTKKKLFLYKDVSDGNNAQSKMVKNINQYLIDASTVFIEPRENPISDVPKMVYGSKFTDGGHLILNDTEKETILSKTPSAQKYIRKFIGSQELSNSTSRWALYIPDITPKELKAYPDIAERVRKVREMRLGSKAKSTNKWADRPMKYKQDNTADTDVLAIPRVGSSKREYHLT